jgi:hypothetical protein
MIMDLAGAMAFFRSIGLNVEGEHSEAKLEEIIKHNSNQTMSALKHRLELRERSEAT